MPRSTARAMSSGTAPNVARLSRCAASVLSHGFVKVSRNGCSALMVPGCRPNYMEHIGFEKVPFLSYHWRHETPPRLCHGSADVDRVGPFQMKDSRVEKLARLLTEYSLRLKPRQVVSIQGDATAAPLIRECYRAALRRGAFVISEITLDGLTEAFFKEANKEKLR